MAIEVFNRHEKKYLMDAGTYEKVQKRLSDYMELDAYNKQQETYSICNLYYDTDDSHLIRTSIQKPKYKEKLRLRSYGTPDGDSKVYVEIKKKICGRGNKRRSAMKLSEAYAFLDSGTLPPIKTYMNRQVLLETAYMLQQHFLQPKVFLTYERRAFFGSGQHDLRISFDTSITTRRTDLKLESGMHGETLLDDQTWLMEIKVAQSIPVWLTQLLSEYKIYPMGFSKYGKEYMKLLGQNTLDRSVWYIPALVHSGIRISV